MIENHTPVPVTSTNRALSQYTAQSDGDGGCQKRQLAWFQKAALTGFNLSQAGLVNRTLKPRFRLLAVVGGGLLCGPYLTFLILFFFHHLSIRPLLIMTVDVCHGTI